MKDIDFTRNFTTQSCNATSTQMAMHFGAGVVDREAFEAAANYKVAVVGGTDSVRLLALNLLDIR
jgi:hypothetical protein